MKYKQIYILAFIAVAVIFAVGGYAFLQKEESLSPTELETTENISDEPISYTSIKTIKPPAGWEAITFEGVRFYKPSQTRLNKKQCSGPSTCDFDILIEEAPDYRSSLILRVEDTEVVLKDYYNRIATNKFTLSGGTDYVKRGGVEGVTYVSSPISGSIYYKYTFIKDGKTYYFRSNGSDVQDKILQSFEFID